MDSDTTVTPAPAYVAPTEEKKLYLAALAKAQGAFPDIPRNRNVEIKSEKGTYRFKYAELAEIIKACRPALSANGLSLRSRLVPGNAPGIVWIQSILAHEGGYEDLSEVSLETVGDIKQFGGRITYMRRYMGTMQLGVAADDDSDEDGKDPGEVSQFGNQQRPATPRAPQRKVTPAPKPEMAQPPAEPAEPPADMSDWTETAPPIGSPKPPAATRGQAPAAAPATNERMANPGQVKWLAEALDGCGLSEEGQTELLEKCGIADRTSLTAANWTKAKQALLALS